MNLALAHDYLIQMGGAERVVATMHRRFPQAPIYTSAVCRRTLWDDFADADIRTTWLQHLPGVEDPRLFKRYFPLYPLAFRSFGRVEAECVWISASTFAKHLRVAPGVRTVCYVHNPTRFLWQPEGYIGHEVGNPALRAAVAAMLPLLRRWDRDAARRMGVLVANSRSVQSRIREFYGRDAAIIHPPVQTGRFAIGEEDGGYYLILSRLIGYKNIDLAVRAFSRARKPLVVIGEGSHRAELERVAGPEVRFMGRLPEAEVREGLMRCRALVFPGEEDFGITPVEAMACGKPVVALRRGGALETVREGESGLFFDAPEEEALLAAVAECERTRWDAVAIRRHAERFSEAVFLEKTEALLRS